MTRSIRAMTLGICLLALATPLLAHHSFTNFWNLDEMRELQGVVKAVKLVNPHCEIILEVTESRIMADIAKPLDPETVQGLLQ